MRIKLRAPIANGSRPSQAVAQQMAQAVVADMIAGIRAGRQLDNTPLRPNKEATRVRKMAAGRKPLSLIDEQHRFITASSYMISTRPGGFTIRLRPDVADIAGHLYDLGYNGFVGLGPRVIKRLMALWKAELVRLLGGNRG